MFDWINAGVSGAHWGGESKAGNFDGYIPGFPRSITSPAGSMNAVSGMSVCVCVSLSDTHTHAQVF